jgi:hypothetical protein
MLIKLKRLKDILIYIYINFCHMFEWLYIIIFLKGRVEKVNQNEQYNSEGPCNYLIVKNRWHRGTPESNESDLCKYLTETFRESEVGNLTEFFIDEFSLNNKNTHIHRELIKLVKANHTTHLMIFVNSDIVNLYNYFSINYIVKLFNIKLIPFAPDSIWFLNQLLIRRFHETSTAIITLDSNYFENSNLIKNKEKFIQMFSPFPISLYSNQSEKRDIDVLFIGRYEGRNSRRLAIEFLINNGVNVLSVGGDPENFLSQKEYINLYLRAKIILSFSYTGNNDEYIQLKGRPFEAAYAGAMLVENKSEMIENFFTPGLDYEGFTSNENLLEIINYYLRNNSERIKLALNGHKKAINFYSGNEFWRIINEKVN